MMTREPGRSMMIFAVLRKTYGFILAKDLLFYSADIHGNLMTRQRIAVWRHLMEEEEGVVVTTLDGLMDHLLPLVFLKQQAVTVENGQVMDLDEWKERLTALGYERTAR